MSVARRGRKSVTPADKVDKLVYTAVQLAKKTGFSSRTFRRAFESGAIPNFVKPGAGGNKMPARVADLAAVESWMRKRGIGNASE